MMPALLPQKLSELTTSRKTNKAIIIRMKGELINYYMKVIYRRRLKAPENAKDISKISQKFKVLMSKRNVNGALKRLTNSMSNGIFPLYKKTLDLLIQKHPEPKESSPETFYRVHFDQFTESHMMASTSLWSCAQQC